MVQDVITQGNSAILLEDEGFVTKLLALFNIWQENKLSEIDEVEQSSGFVEIPEEYDREIHSAALMERFMGHFLLLVEDGYPANLYYVNPYEELSHRYILTWETMLDTFAHLSLGITNDNLEMIPTCDSDERLNPHSFDFPTLLLNVDHGGEISYYYEGCRELVTWDNMWEVLPGFAQGINLENLQKIPYGEIEL